MIEKIKKSKGITLVAVVITVIILIILAGVSIGILTGENGLIARTKKATEQYENAVKAEQEQLNKIYGEFKIATTENGQVTLNMSDLNSVIDSRINLAKQEIKDEAKEEAKLEIYPVGSIYMSMNSTNPATLFGGTWEQIAQGKTLVGIDTNDADFDTVEETGGEKTHTLTEDEMPRHKHSIIGGTNYQYTVGSGANTSGNAKFFSVSGNLLDNYKNIWDMRADYKGGDQAHNNLQPYMVTYIWKRTA